ncbi:MAG: hypothetical protein H6R19_480 [Proteobacteria bacterium]|nr:hypothetical protein [Pseudomonadota bacterium]
MSNRISSGASARRLTAFNRFLALIPSELSFRDAAMCPEPSCSAVTH